MTLPEKIKCLFKLVNKHTQQIKELFELIQNGGGTGIPEAPQDGQFYARQDGAWVAINDNFGFKNLQQMWENDNQSLIVSVQQEPGAQPLEMQMGLVHNNVVGSTSVTIMGISVQSETEPGAPQIISQTVKDDNGEQVEKFIGFTDTEINLTRDRNSIIESSSFITLPSTSEGQMIHTLPSETGIFALEP